MPPCKCRLRRRVGSDHGALHPVRTPARRRPPAPRLAGRGRRRPRLAGRRAGGARLVRRPGQRDRGRELQGRLDRLGHPGRRRRRRGAPGLHDEHQRPAGRHGAVQDRRRRRVHDRHLPHGLLRRGGRAQGGDDVAHSAPADQPACPKQRGTRMVDCGSWAVSASWAVPATAVSGIYFAKLTAPGGGASHVVFVVRDDDGSSDLLFQTSDTTWQAYNAYGGNSLYVGRRRTPAARLQGQLRPALQHARRRRRRTGCSTPSTRWSAGSRPTATT